MTQYEYKCVPAPTGLSVTSKEGESAAIRAFTEFINQNCSGGWEFVSMGQISITTHPGCIAGLFGASATYSNYNMLVFRKQK